MQQPKHIYKPFNNRNKVIGNERRLNAVKTVLNNQPHFPKPVVYEDIDQAVFDWVDNEFELNYNNKRFPTYKLFSNQRISEYGQNWKELDDKGNLEINFKTITRENNPQKGENQGGNFNIPGNREYPIFKTTVVEENGDEVVQIYTMKQPYSVNLIYTVSIITSSYKKLNEMNMKMQAQFKGLEKYIFPNGFAMPMILNSVGDESDYQIDDRKYYAQTYQIKLMGYIINEDDYVVKKIPSRPRMMFVAGENSRRNKKDNTFKLQTVDNTNYNIIDTLQDNKCNKSIELTQIKNEVTFKEQYCKLNEDEDLVTIEDYLGLQPCWENTEDEMYVNKKVIITINFKECNKVCEFELDSKLEIESFELNNIKDYKLYLNGDELKIEDSDILFNEGDIVKVECNLKDETEKGKIRIICYDPTTIIENIQGKEENNEEIILQ